MACNPQFVTSIGMKFANKRLLLRLGAGPPQQSLVFPWEYVIYYKGEANVSLASNCVTLGNLSAQPSSPNGAALSHKTLFNPTHSTHPLQFCVVCIILESRPETTWTSAIANDWGMVLAPL